MTRATKLAAFNTSALFSYYELFRWIPWGAWNGEWHFPVHNDQFYPDIVIGALLLWISYSFSRLRRVGMWTGWRRTARAVGRRAYERLVDDQVDSLRRGHWRRAR